MTVREYYYQNFDKLTNDKKFHFATRIKNYFGSHDFDHFFAVYMPSTDLKAIYDNNDYTKVNRVELRQLFFEKYDHLFAIEAMLFRVMHLLHEYNLDLREDFIKIVPLDDLYKLADDLLSDDEAIMVLSTWAVNVICLTETLFPRGQNVVKILAEKSLNLEVRDPLLSVYLYTHIIICDSEFYVKPVAEKALAKKMLDKTLEIVNNHPSQLILDLQIEFLVCANMVGVDYPAFRQQVAAECSQILASSPFLFDTRAPKARQTFDGAEHTNVLYIMSGLDSAKL